MNPRIAAPFTASFPIRSLTDIRRLEQTPLEQALTVRSTYEIFRNSARTFGEKTALTFLRSGDPANAILHLAEAENVDVIALGWRQDLSADRARVARTILTEAKRPVALIPLPDVRQWSDPER